MKPVFADTGFWIALLHKKDRWHQQAIKIYQNLQAPGVTALYGL